MAFEQGSLDYSPLMNFPLFGPSPIVIANIIVSRSRKSPLIAHYAAKRFNAVSDLDAAFVQDRTVAIDHGSPEQHHFSFASRRVRGGLGGGDHTASRWRSFFFANLTLLASAISLGLCDC